jgi:uncharacterized protein YqeY
VDESTAGSRGWNAPTQFLKTARAAPACARELEALGDAIVKAVQAWHRADLAEGENAEIAILSAYMPEQMSDADVDALVAEAISATGAASAKEMGKVMGWLGPKTKGRVDGKVLSGKVTAALAARG